MFNVLKKQTKQLPVPEQIYGVVVARARDPRFFLDLGFPDTVMGRFDVLAMHVYLFSRRMRGEQSNIAISLSQDVFDLFVADVERALRELGIGDTSIPKRKQKMIRSFYGQIEDFDKALEESDASTLARKAEERYLPTQDDGHGMKIAEYIASNAEALSQTDFETFESADFEWPEFSD